MQEDLAEQKRKRKIHELWRRKARIANEISTLCERRIQTLIPSCKNALLLPVCLRGTQTFFKVVAASKTGFVSIFDGQTRYQLGRWTRSKRGTSNLTWPPLPSCFFVTSDPRSAVIDTPRNTFYVYFKVESHYPDRAQAKGAPRVLLRVECKGKAFVDETGRCWAVAQLRPIRILQFHVSSTEPFLLPSNFLRTDC